MKSTVGLGLRHSFHGYVLEHKPAVPFFEVITENYLYFDGAPRSFLAQIREDYPIVFHGVSLSIGSLESVRMDYLTRLKKMIGEFQPLWISDHLCWTYNGAENSHDLLPIPFTKESIKRIVSKTLQTQELLGQKIYLENPSAYVDFKNSDYSEQDFIVELCKQAGCGLLLDLNNLVVNQYNLGYQPINYLNTIKNCDVKQIHLAGHTIKEKVRIDTHDSDISQEVLDLLPVAKQFWPNANPMIEWDDKIPQIEYLLDQREKIEIKWNGAVLAERDQFTLSDSVRSENSLPDKEKHQAFWKLLKAEDYVEDSDVRKANILSTDLPTPAHIGMNVYSSAYYNRQFEVLEKTFPVLKAVLNELFNDVISEYLKHYPSVYDSIDFIGGNLDKFIKEHEFNYSLGVDNLIVSDVANFENCKNLGLVALADQNPTLSSKLLTESDWVNKRLKLKSEVLFMKFNSEIHYAVESIQKGEVPEIPEMKNAYYVFFRINKEFSYRAISEDEFNLLNLFTGFATFPEATSSKSSDQVQTIIKLLLMNENLFCIEQS